MAMRWPRIEQAIISDKNGTGMKYAYKQVTNPFIAAETLNLSP